MNFYQRLMRIQSVCDIQSEINKASRLIKRRRAEAKNPNFSLAEKIEMGRKVKADELVRQTLVLNQFDIEDNLAAGTMVDYVERFHPRHQLETEHE